tara:strand:- start:306 stop:599 length:294 start_codon:yes stop_codon:yes gene_type:complete
MSDIDLDFNVNHYNYEELEKMIEIESPYGYEDIQKQSMKLKIKLLNIESLGRDKKEEISLFIKHIIETLERKHIEKMLGKIMTKVDSIEKRLDKLSL